MAADANLCWHHTQPNENALLPTLALYCPPVLERDALPAFLQDGNRSRLTTCRDWRHGPLRLMVKSTENDMKAIKKHANRASEKTKPDFLTPLLMLPFSGGIFGCAGAFFIAMVFPLFTLDLVALRLGAGILIQGLFDSIFIAISKTLTLGSPIACCIAIAVTYSDRKKKPEEAWKAPDWILTAILPFLTALLVMGVLLYLAMAMYCLIISALEMSRWGTYIGSVLGFLLGCLAAFATAGDKHPRRTGRDRKKGEAASFHELDWWMASNDDHDIGTDE